MAGLWLLDTDVMVDFLRGHPKAVALVKDNLDRIALSTIVVAELYAGVRDGEERQRLDRLSSDLRTLPVSSEIAQQGGLYKRDYGQSHGVGLADAIIAATAEIRTAELKTLNTRHYPMFQHLQPAYEKG